MPVSTYLRKMDRAGIERSLLIAVRAGDLNVRGSVRTAVRSCRRGVRPPGRSLLRPRGVWILAAA
jgi:hypothetical protein